MTISCHVVFSGRVQGVGFRYTARNTARELGLTGWVKNLPTGKVEMLAEGDPGAVDQLLASLAANFSITEMQSTRSEISGRFSAFDISF